MRKLRDYIQANTAVGKRFKGRFNIESMRKKLRLKGNLKKISLVYEFLSVTKQIDTKEILCSTKYQGKLFNFKLSNLYQRGMI